MAAKVKRVPEGMHTVTPHLVVQNAAGAIEFYRKAFGAKELSRHAGLDGKAIMHAEIQIGDSRVFLNDEFPEWGSRSPKSIGGTGVTIHLCVEDADAVFNQAVKAGAEVVMPLMDMFWGDRYGTVKDPSGHQWSIAHHIKDPTPEEIKKGMEAMASGAG